ncbi:MAG: energy transducer TonB [Janthinobacterium lividum]
MKHHSGLPIAPLLALALLAFNCPVPRAQLLKPTPQQMRDNLAQVSAIAGIETEGAAPFRLSATFATYDYLGKPAGEGTLEEVWLQPGVARRAITFRGHRSEQTVRNGSVRGKDEGFTSSFMQRRIVAALLDAVPEGRSLPEASRLTYHGYKVNGGMLDCIVVKAAEPVKSSATEDGPATAYCSDPVTHTLRVRQERYDFAVVYNNLARLRDHTIAQKIQITQAGKLRATLQVTSFAAASNLSEADFVLPPNTSDLSRAEVELPEEVIAGRVLKKKAPTYPETAKRNHISGTVFLSATIGKEGTIKELDVISSPSPDLTETAMDAVRQWKYTPYLVGGVAQEVNTTIRVNYSFSR